MPKTPEEIAAEAAAAKPEGPWTALGFDTFEAYDKDQKERQAKVEKQAADKQAMIDRQGSEIGELRTDLKTLTESFQKQSDTTSPAGTKETPDGDNYSKMTLDELNASLPEATREQAVKMLEGLKPEEQAVVTQSEESQATFLRHVLRTQEAAPTSFLDRLKSPAKPTEESLEKQIQGLFGELKRPASSPASDLHGIPGLARTREELEAVQRAEAKRTNENPTLIGGDLSGSIAALKSGS
jgi:hypothetical protein